MKSLWIVNKCCGALHLERYKRKSTSGLWLDAMLEEARDSDDSIVVVNIEKKVTLPEFKDGNITYYTLQGVPKDKYDYKSPKNIEAWRRIIEKEKPDVIEIWGTEFPYALAALKATEKKLPSVIYIQGILDSIGKYYLAGISDKEIRGSVTVRDILTRTTIPQIKRRFEKNAEYEKEIIALSGHIIAENQWTIAYCTKILPDIKTHYLPLQISTSFYNHSWSEDTMIKHTVMCPAANYSIKGLHMLLKAIHIVKKKYPDVKLYVPGLPLIKTDTIELKLKQHGYDRLITKMIKSLGLLDNVSYTGALVADEMAQKMSEVNCFAMCSAIENHSSTLKEAMTVGVPCIASYVGGVPEYATNGENCLLYRFEDYEVLAQNICKLFEDKDLRAKLSHNARKLMIVPKEKTDYQQMRGILEEVASAE